MNRRDLQMLTRWTSGWGWLLSAPCGSVYGLLVVVTMATTGLSACAEESTDMAFRDLVDEVWEFEMRADPLRATEVGDHRFNDELPDVSFEALKQQHEQRQAFRERLSAISPEKLSPAERVNRAILGRLLDDRMAEFRFGAHLMPITSRSGFHVEFPELGRRVPLATREDYENYIARLRAFPRYTQQHIALMREGMKREKVLPDVALTGLDRTLGSQVVQEATASPLYRPFEQFPETFSAEQEAALKRAGSAAIVEAVAPAYRKFLEFMQQKYIPAARGSVGISALPEGRAYYRHRVRRFTTLDLSPEQVHQTGLDEVQRIAAEMTQVMRQTGFEGDFAAFVKMLRTEKRFYAQTPEELLRRVAMVLKTADGRLPGLFGKLPRMSYGIRQIPDYIAPRTTTAYYMPPAGDGTKAGFYYVNTYDLKSRPLFEITALSLHEAVPGHHLQIALQQELDDLPKFRRYAGITAFIEGWALYAERLGLEMDMYDDPYDNFGRLSYEMWRACRLVVDSGIHYLGWSRRQAIDFMARHTALSLHNIEAEVDRYISWPGQALAYKSGELKIRALRHRAEERLGARFDVRRFHDAVLSQGAVPLDVLENMVEQFIQREKRRQNGGGR